jgi:type IV secretion system protein VirD4
MRLRIGIFSLCLIIGCWASTILLTLKLKTGALPPGEWFSFQGCKVFPPWSWIKWFYLYGERFETAFAKTVWPIYLATIIGIAMAWLTRLLHRSNKPSTAHGSAEWAEECDLKKAGLTTEHGVVLGQSKDSPQILRHNGPEHILVVAPTRGGKGVGLVIPTLLSWEESVIVFDPKGENWQISSGYRATLGKCLCFDPTSRDTACFNPLMEIRKGDLEVKDAQNIADIIVDPDGRLDTRNHWQNAAHSLLVGAVLYVIYDWPRKSLAGVVEFLTRPNHTFEQALEMMATSNHEVVKSVAQEMLNKHVEERSGVLSTAISLLSIFRDPLVAHATDFHDFSASSLKSSELKTSLYLVLPPSDLSRLRVLLRIILNQIGRVLTERPDDGRTQNRRVLFLLDEFPALGRLEFFESALAYMAGYGLKAFLICQSLNQLQKAYGERNSILDNCHVRVAFANNDDQTARRLSDLLGEATATKDQISMSGDRFAMVLKNTSVSQVQYARPLLLPSEINRLPADQELILVNGVLPILARKIRYYQDARFKDRLYPPIILASRARSAVITKGPSLFELAPDAKTVSSAQPEPIGSAL